MIPIVRWVLPHLILVTLLLLTGCSGAPDAVQIDAGWQPGDLRGLELPNTGTPNSDLVAAYVRLTSTDLELRFDLFGSPGPFDYDVYLTLDTGPGAPSGEILKTIISPSEWEILLHFPARGSPRAISAGGQPASIRPRILRNSLQDSFTVRISRSVLPGDPQEIAFEAFLTAPGQTSISDKIGPFKVGAQPPDTQAPVVLVFWDGLPSATPAQALRRWDGAHTGPFGQRHGLGVLLRAASTTRTPLAILDIKEPGRLAALEALGGLDLVREMQRSNLLLLPDLASGDPTTAAGSLLTSRRGARQFGLASNPFFFGSLAGEIPRGYQVGFARLDGSPSILTWNDIRLIPLPAIVESETGQVDSQGPTADIRLALLETALSVDPHDLVILGGSLPTSPWGDSLVAGPALEFLAGHPWIKVLNAASLLNFPTVPGGPTCPDLLCLPEPAPSELAGQVRAALQEAPDNLFSRLAWRTWGSLTEPTDDERRAALQASYLRQIGGLLAAARWNESPHPESACQSDLDWDGDPECILASETLFLVFEQQEAMLVLAAARTRQGPLQWIAPRSQFAVGLGDPSEWLADRNSLVDPQEIPGAFGGLVDEDRKFHANLQPGLAVFTHATNGTRKMFRLENMRLQVSVESDQPITSQLPLALLDQVSYSPGWLARYQAKEPIDLTSVTWGQSGGVTISVKSQAAQLSLHSFAESLGYLEAPEDPDFGYPPGHFIPFPLAVIDIQSEGSFALEITLQD